MRPLFNPEGLCPSFILFSFLTICFRLSSVSFRNSLFIRSVTPDNFIVRPPFSFRRRPEFCHEPTHQKCQGDDDSGEKQAHSR